MLVHTITVRERRATVDEPRMVQGTANEDRVRLDLDAEWDGLDASVTFEGAGQKLSPARGVDGAFPVPWEVLAEPGAVYVAVEGRSGTELLAHATMDRPMRVLPSMSPVNSVGPEDPTVTELQGAKRDALAAAESANDAATKATDAASAANSAADTANAAASTAQSTAQAAAERADAAAGMATDAASKATDATSRTEAAIAAAKRQADAAQTLSDQIKSNADSGVYNGKPFGIAKIYGSVAEMEADTAHAGVSTGDFVAIVSDVEDEDNAKLYLRTDAGWSYIVDMSGATGIQGPAATINVGSVSTLAPGSKATVTNSGDSNAAVFDFGIPAGIQGEKGDAATVKVGSVTTLEPGSKATVANSGDSHAAVLDFSLPRGDKGDKGDTGAVASKLVIYRNPQGQASGGQLTLSDGTLVPLTVIERASKNLLHYGHLSKQGISFSVDDAGQLVLTADGTNVKWANGSFHFKADEIAPIAGKAVAFSCAGVPDGMSARVYYADAAGALSYIAAGSSATVPEGATKLYLYVELRQEGMSGAWPLRPQLEYGAEPTAWDRPDDIERWGGVVAPNLLRYGPAGPGSTGIAASVNADGTLHIEGTPAAKGQLVFWQQDAAALAGKRVFMSANGIDGAKYLVGIYGVAGDGTAFNCYQGNSIKLPDSIKWVNFLVYAQASAVGDPLSADVSPMLAEFDREVAFERPADTGWGGVFLSNLWLQTTDNATSNGVRFESNAIGGYHAFGENDGSVGNSQSGSRTVSMPAGAYTLSCEGSTAGCYAQIVLIRADGTTTYPNTSNGPVTFRVADGDRLRCLLQAKKGAGKVDTVLYPMLVSGTEARPYVPYERGGGTS